MIGRMLKEMAYKKQLTAQYRCAILKKVVLYGGQAEDSRCRNGVSVSPTEEKSLCYDENVSLPVFGEAFYL